MAAVKQQEADANGRSTPTEQASWLNDPLEAMTREPGPHTVESAEEYLENYAVEL